jgi:polysaccharide export outer membrane protein
MASLVPGLLLWAAASPAVGAEAGLDRVGSAGVEEYVIGMDDVLNVTVWRNEAFSRTVRVRPDGKITLPLVDDIVAAGLTPSGLRRVITQLLAEYVDNPKVSVIVQEINSAKITILGEVRKPGIYPLKAHMTMFDAVALAEGFSDFASPNQIVILRNNGGAVKRINVKYFEAVKGSVDIDHLRLETGDTILVP